MAENQSPTAEPKYPDVHVQLTGRSSHTGAIMAAVADALRDHGVPAAEVDQMRTEMLSSDYNNVLRTAMRWVGVS